MFQNGSRRINFESNSSPLSTVDHLMNILHLSFVNFECKFVNVYGKSDPDPPVSLDHCLALFSRHSVLTSVYNVAITCARTSEDFLTI